MDRFLTKVAVEVVTLSCVWAFLYAVLWVMCHGTYVLSWAEMPTPNNQQLFVVAGLLAAVK